MDWKEVLRNHLVEVENEERGSLNCSLHLSWVGSIEK